MNVPINDSPATPRALRRLSDEKAFYFYAGIGRPIYLKANSLDEFVEKLRIIDAGSIAFHTSRGDFGRWLSMLGDQTLVQSIANLRQRNLRPEELRQRLLEITSSRLTRLRRVER